MAQPATLLVRVEAGAAAGPPLVPPFAVCEAAPGLGRARRLPERDPVCRRLPAGPAIRRGRLGDHGGSRPARAGRLDPAPQPPAGGDASPASGHRNPSLAALFTSRTGKK